MNMCRLLCVSLLLCGTLAAYQRRISDNIDNWSYGFELRPEFVPVKRFWSRTMLKRSHALNGVERLVGVVNKLNAGERIVVAVLGSSICSDRGGCWHKNMSDVDKLVASPGHVYQKNKCENTNSRQGFLRHFMYLINQTWPGNHVLVNGAKPGAGLGVFARGACLEQNFPQAADLLIVEHHHAGDSGGGPELEQVLWRLYQHFGHMPAVILMNSMRVVETVPEINCMRKAECQGPCLLTFKSILEDQEMAAEAMQSESQFNVLASFYSLASVSLRNFFWLAIRDQVPQRFNQTVCAFYRTVLADTIHQNHVGNVLMADMLVDLLWQAEAHIALEDAHPSSALALLKPEQMRMPQLTIYHEGDAVAEHRCYGTPGEGMPTMNVKMMTGWEFVEYQMHGTERKYKPGYVSMTPGSKIQIMVDASNKEVETTATSYVMVGILYLRSYEHMGMAAMRCISGCECKEGIIQAHNARTTTSLVNYFGVKATPSPQCLIEIEVLQKTTSGGYKFKISQVSFTGTDISAITNKPYISASTMIKKRRGPKGKRGKKGGADFGDGVDQERRSRKSDF